MLILGILIGIYSYVILVLGLLGLINYKSIFFISSFVLFLLYLLIENKLLKKQYLIFFKTRKILAVFLAIISFALVNLMGSLGPEIAFDSTWYHLTIPKIFIEQGRIYFIDGNLFYYSLMPKLSEMLYLSALSISNEIAAKVIHFSFGILSAIVTYRIGRLYLDHYQSLYASLIFYSNLVIAWLSITAFVDLTRTFYEALALYYFLHFVKSCDKKQLIYSAVLLGFAISTKLLSLLTIHIFILVLFLTKRIEIVKKVGLGSLYLVISLMIPLPWFLIAFYHTGNPIYPLITKLPSPSYDLSTIFPQNILETYYKFFVISSDPISPIYIVILPLLIFNFRKLLTKYRAITLFVLCSLIILLITPINGGGRFVVQFLPAYSVLTSILVFKFAKKGYQKILILSVFAIFSINVSYRLFANAKYLPVVFGLETKQEFLLKNLNFDFGDFYDENHEVEKRVGNNKVLLLGMHNLYYVDFNFTLEEWKDKDFDFVLVQKGDLPEKYSGQLIYENLKTHVKLYKIEK